MRKFLFTSLALIVLTFAAAQESLACKCMASNEPLEAQVANSYQHSAAVFSGQVLTISKTDETISVTFKVLDRWKAVIGSKITVTTASSSAACGYSFVSGENYLVYAHENDNGFSASSCSRTALLSKMAEDVKFLAKLKEKAPSAAGEKLLDLGQTQDLIEESTDWLADLIGERELENSVEKAWIARGSQGGKTRREVLQILYADAVVIIKDPETLARFQKGWKSYQPKP